MNPNELIIRYEQVGEQAEGAVKRLVGFVRAKHMLQLFDAADLDANPRSAKAGAVTADIIESIENTPELFPFKTKGILVGAADYEPLDRKRYRLTFEKPQIEGILDGGHNMLAIGTYLLKQVMEDTRALKRVKTWPDFKEAWTANRTEIDKLKADEGNAEGGPLDFFVPIEVLVPADLEDDDVVAEFSESLLDICAARNNNVELTLETRANKKGYYEELRRYLPKEIAARVEWKTNAGGDIKARDLVALAWIPLSLIELPPSVSAPNRVKIYSSKGECSKAFDELMGDPSVSKATGGEYTHELHNVSVGSALKIAAELPRLYDEIYTRFPEAYNGNSEGRFGAISVVKIASQMRTKPTSPFTRQPVRYSYPDGLIMPLVYGLVELMQVGPDGQVRWKVEPLPFLDDHLESIVRKYRVILEAFRFDPQKIAKNEGSYDLVVDAFETELLKLRQAA
jgi:hypothetical protein